jgi:hypothetical protein
VKASLFLMHDANVLAWIKPEGENLAARLVKLEDPAAVADELYVSVLSRPPADDEKQAVADYLAGKADHRERAVSNLIWSLVASNEFCSNH